MADRRASSRPGDSYLDDAYYLPIERPLEQKYGLPDGLLSRIRKDGEKTDRTRVSSAGAKSVYQIIPGTRDLFLNKYGVNAYESDAAAAKVAALHLKESWDATDGNLETTVRQYHGGPNRSRWGKINDAYAARVLGKATPLLRETRGTTVLAPEVDLSTVDVAALQGIRPADMGSRRPLDRRPVTAAEVAPKPTGAGIILGTAMATDATPGSDQATSQQAREGQVTATQEETARQAISFGDRLEESWDRNWAVSMLARAADQEAYEGDPEWHKEYLSKIDDYEGLAKTQDELDELRSSRAQNSRNDFFAVVRNIEARRKSEEVVNSNGTGWAFDLSASLTDPVATALTLGSGKLLQVGATAGKTGAAAIAARPSAMAMMAEGAAFNIGFTGLMDASGQQQTVTDYITAGTLGVAIGGALHGISTRLGKADTSASDLLVPLEVDTARVLNEIEASAAAKAGPSATPDQVEQARQEVVVDRAEQAMRMAIAQRPDIDRFMPVDPEFLKTNNQQLSKDLATTTGLDSIADPATRKLSVEVYARSTDIVAQAKAAGDLDKGLEGRFLKAFGQESDAITLLRSKNPIMQATAIQLLESTTGAGGRKPSAAISKVMRERRYMGHMVDFDQAYDLWRKGEGIGKATALMSPDTRNSFDRLVFREVEARGKDVPLTANPGIRKAADAWERGMDMMRREMQEIGTLGNERLGDTSKGYMRHMIETRKLMTLKKEQPNVYRTVETVMARQFQQLNEYSYVNEAGEKITKAFDPKFSRELAKRYLDEAIERGKGSVFIPVNLQTGEGADIVSDALKAMKGLSDQEAEAILGRFSRGGASFTKGRLALDMSEEIGNGMQLGDLFNQDLLGLFRSYARRSAGEVALAQYGILGKQTLDLMRSAASRSGAEIKELEAFERVASEFLNQPWHRAVNISAFKNMRSITSSSMLGGMGFTQLGEQGNAIIAVGIKAALSIVPEFKRLRTEVGMWRKGEVPKNDIIGDMDEIYGFIGGDGFNMTRLFDAPDSQVELYGQEAIGTFSKVIRAGSHLTAVASGFRIIHAVQTRGMAENIVKKAIRYIHLDKESAALADMGINEEIRGAFKANMDQIAKFDRKGNLLSLDLFNNSIDPRIIQDFAQTIERGAGQIIQKTFIGETGAWAHNDVLKSLLQFRTFGVTSIEKQYGRNRANYGAIKSAAILFGAMAFALPIHLARLQVQSAGMSRSEKDEFMEKRTNTYALSKAVLQYTSVSGLLPDFLDIASSIGAKVGVIPAGAAEEAGIRGRQVGATGMVPGIGYADKALKAVHGDYKQLPKLLPGSNLPFVVPIINGLTPEDE